MRNTIKRNTGREVTKCSFQIDVKDIDENVMQYSNYLYLTGYLWDSKSQKKTVLNTLKAAFKASATGSNSGKAVGNFAPAN